MFDDSRVEHQLFYGIMAFAEDFTNNSYAFSSHSMAAPLFGWLVDFHHDCDAPYYPNYFPFCCAKFESKFQKNKIQSEKTLKNHCKKN